MPDNVVQLEEFAYSTDSCALFEKVSDLPEALFLDSGSPHSSAGRFDIIAADPLESIHLNCSNTTTYDDIQNYFQSIVKVHSSYCNGLLAPREDIPFCGGVAGYLDYELGAPLQHLAATEGAQARLNFYPWALVQDHVLQRCTLATLPCLPAARRTALLERLRAPRTPLVTAEFKLQQTFASNLDKQTYQQAHATIENYIHAGDCYQVNLAQRFASRFRGDPWRAYLKLREVAGAHFAAYMECSGERQLLCFSPERFLKVDGRRVESRPIKGTRPRHLDPATDAAMREQLRCSAKDRAENLMIVDLLRNDLGRNCRPGSIAVERLFELESYPLVHHLVSTISGELAADRNACDLLRDSFPGGSITGAPKRRAMEIIRELEPDRRRAYCGSVLYISADGRMDSNIAIRTLLCEQQQIFGWAGGGIVADSQWQQEYQETWDKIGRLLQTLEATIA